MQLRGLLPYIRIGLFRVNDDESYEKIGHLESCVISIENAW